MLASGRFVPLSVDKDIHLHTSGFTAGSHSPKQTSLLNLSGAFQVTSLPLSVHYLAIPQGRRNLGAMLWTLSQLVSIYVCWVCFTMKEKRASWQKCAIREVREVRFEPLCQQYLPHSYWSILEQVTDCLHWCAEADHGSLETSCKRSLWGLIGNLMVMDYSDTQSGRQRQSFSPTTLFLMLCHTSWLTSLTLLSCPTEIRGASPSCLKDRFGIFQVLLNPYESHFVWIVCNITYTVCSIGCLL